MIIFKYSTLSNKIDTQWKTKRKVNIIQGISARAFNILTNKISLFVLCYIIFISSVALVHIWTKRDTHTHTNIFFYFSQSSRK